MKPFGPTLTEAGVAKRLSDAPIAGAPVRCTLGDAIEQMRDVEKGLKRFKDAKAADLGEEGAKKLSDEALAATAAKPARDLDQDQARCVYERAWRGIPENMRQAIKGHGALLGGFTETKKLLEASPSATNACSWCVRQED